MFAVPARPEAVAELEAAGADEVLFNLRTEPEDGTLRGLDRLAALL
ncbi:hypothetical protein [Actinomadura coerulea]